MGDPHLETLLVNQSRILNALLSESGFEGHGYTVFSQWDEDGLIQFLVGRVNPPKIFVEIGAGNFTECNTRLLSVKDHWSGLLVEIDRELAGEIVARNDYWKHPHKVVCEAVHAGNVNRLLAENGCTGEVGLLSIDVDGIDYWIWRAVEAISPAILVCEYNGVFGGELRVSVPYDQGFNRFRSHYSGLYAGASLAALVELGCTKGYAFVGTNSGRNNAFFVRHDLVGDAVRARADLEYIEPPFREARDEAGELSYLSPAEGRHLLRDMEVVVTTTGEIRALRDLL